MRFLYFFALFFGLMRDISALPSLKTLPADHVLKATFTQQRHLRDIPKPIQSKGELLLWSGKGLLWKTHSPFPSTILLTKKGLFQRENDKRVPLIKTEQGGEEGALFEMLSKILSGSFTELNGFTMEALPSSHGKWKMRLTPTQPALEEFIASIEVEGDAFISHLVIHRTSEDQDDILIHNQTVIESHALSPTEKTEFDE